MSYLDNFNVERIDSIPEVKQQLRNLRRAIDNKEIGTYTPPSTGIPKTDLSQEVRNSLLKADNAVPTAISTTYSELKALRDNSQLIPGCWYRITDYECTTSQAHTKSAGHKFDILVLATSVNTLSEEARAIQSERDKELKSIYSDSYGSTYTRYANEDGNFEGEHYYAFFRVDNGDYIYTKSLTEIPTENTVFEFEDNDNNFVSVKNAIGYNSFLSLGETIDSYTGFYFSNSNLNAWKIWYCLDNDTSRFAWAADYELPEGLNRLIRVYVANDVESYIYVRYPQEDKNGEFAFAYGGGAGDGTTILQYIDAENYNIGNTDIMYSLVESPTINDTVHYKGDITPLQILETSDKGKGVIYRMIDEWNNDCPYDFKNIQFERYNLTNFITVPSLNYNDANNVYHLPYGAYDLDGTQVISNCSYGGCFYVYTFALKDLNSENYYDYTVEAHRGLKNDEGNEMCCYNNIIQPATNEYLSGNGFCAKMLNNCVFFSVYENISTPSFSNEFSICSRIKLGIDCYSLTFGINCYDIIYGNGCNLWTCGYNCYGFICGDNCNSNILGNGCFNWICGDGCHTFTCGDNCRNWTCGCYCDTWSILAQDCSYWTCGIRCSGWTIVNNKTKYFNLLSGCGSTLNLSNYLTANVDYVQCIGKTTNGNVRVWNPADPSGT